MLAAGAALRSALRSLAGLAATSMVRRKASVEWSSRGAKSPCRGPRAVRDGWRGTAPRRADLEPQERLAGLRRGGASRVRSGAFAAWRQSV
jgi:hypothetical protein